VRDGHGREGLAAAAGAAAVAAPLAHSKHRDAHDEGLQTRQATYGDQPSAIPTTTSSIPASTASQPHHENLAASNNPTSTTSQHHPEALAAARAAALGTAAQGHPTGTHDNALGNTSTTSTGLPATQSHDTGVLGGARPGNHRSESRPHIPGEFPTPTPDESKTFLYYRSELVPEPGATTQLTPGHHAARDQTIAPVSAGTSATTAGPHTSDALNKADPRVDSDRDGSRTLGATSGTSTGPHELRHTGTLDEPQPRSADHDDHTGRNAAIAGGLGAGAAGLGYAATQKHGHHGVDSSSPYSSTTMDPRVLGNQSKLEEQRFDPHATSTSTAAHTGSTPDPQLGSTSSTAKTGPVHDSNLLNKLDPRVKDVPESTSKPNTHHGRDATLTGTGLGAGAATARDHHSSPTTTSSTTSTTHNPTATTGPVHDNNTLNKLDPRVKEVDSASSRPLDSTTSTQKDTDHHHGRDAALVGAGLGAGAGAVAAKDHHSTPATTSSATTNPSTTTGSVHDSKVLNKVDPRVKETESTSSRPVDSTDLTHKKDTDHHHGRDAAVVGAGASAATAKDHHHTPDTSSTTAAHDGSPTLTGPVHKSSLLNKLDPRVKEVKNEPTGTSSTTTATEKKDPEHHYGRDATLAGAGAATGAGVHHALQRNDTPGTGTAVLSQETSNTSVPVTKSALGTSSVPATSNAPATSSELPASTSNVPASHASTAPTSGSAAPSAIAPTSTSSSHQTPAEAANFPTYKGPLTTSGQPFYGTAGAPAPIEGSKSASAHHGTPTTATIGPITHDKDSHHGRDAALAGGAAAGLGGLAHASQHDKSDTGPASKTIGPHSSNAANVLDPRVQPDPSKQSHHTSGSTAQDPASRTIGPHDSNVANVLDPRVQPDPNKQSAHATGTHQPEISAHKDHHYGRDAAALGGAGAAGYGAHEAAKAYGDHRSTQPGASMNEQRYDSSAAGAHAPNPVPAAGHYDYNNKATSRNVNQPLVGHTDATRDNTGRNVGLGGAALGAGALGGAAYGASKHGDSAHHAPSASQPLSSATSSQPLSASSQPLSSSQTAQGIHGQHDLTMDHTNRNLGLGGAALGAGALGGAAYGASTHGDHQTPTSASQPLSSTAQPLSSSQSQPYHGVLGHRDDSASATYPTQGTIAPQNTQTGVPGTAHNRFDSVQHPEDKDHTKRNAALAGTAGAAVAGGAYAHSQQQDDERERARLEKEQHKLDKEQQKEQHKLDKEQHKQEKEAHKQEKETHKLEKEQHKHDKEAAAAAALAAKEEKKHHKEDEKLEKERRKEAERAEKEHEKEAEPEKKHGILGFLHRDKTKKEKRGSNDSSPRQSGEVRRSLDSNPRHSRELEHDNPDSPRWKGKNLLHKDPPKGHPAREARDDIELQSGKREHVGVDGPIGRPDAISGYEPTSKGVYGAQPLSEIPEPKTVTEPHTGLPMNVGKYGDGAGGTDANPAIHGHHHGTRGTHGTAAGTDPGLGSGQGHTADVDGIKKNDTLY